MASIGHLRTVCMHAHAYVRNLRFDSRHEHGVSGDDQHYYIHDDDDDDDDDDDRY